jgi:hypothetical protein
LAKSGNVVIVHLPYFMLVLKGRGQDDIITIHDIITIQELLAAFAEFQTHDFK